MRAYKWALLVVRPWQVLSSLNHFNFRMTETVLDCGSGIDVLIQSRTQLSASKQSGMGFKCMITSQ